MDAAAGRAEEGCGMRITEIEARDTKAVRTAVDFAVEKYRRNKVAIYKGSENYWSEEGVFYRDPTAHAQPRISANTQNYTTLWVDNSKAWSHFPKRGRSLICTTDQQTAENYGTAAVVIPLQDTRIGICPAMDFWESFDETMPAAHGIVDLNSFIDGTIKKQLKRVVDQRTLTYRDLVNILDELRLPETPGAKYKFYGIVEQHGWQGMMEVILDPRTNGFRVSTWRQFSTTGDHEVWLSAPCAMLRADLFQKLAKNEIKIDDFMT